MTARHTILVVDDDPAVLEALETIFEDDYKVIACCSASETVRHLSEDSEIAAAVLDIKMAETNGLELGRRLRELLPNTPIIFHTAYAGEFAEEEVDSSERPFDFIEKGTSTTRLQRSVRNAVQAYDSYAKSENLVNEAKESFGMVGHSAAMQEVFRLIRKVAATDSKVMILGETGTGKELVARAIHSNSHRKSQHLGIVNCNHKTTDLVEAELFGYKRGAFTGAYNDRKGLFEIANGGTVFLDEIGDLSSTTQIALLRVLETGEFQQSGPEAEVRQADVRIICATHKNLESMVQSGSFRQDLYYRLKGIVIELPPLRTRREDIAPLVEAFRERAALQGGLPFKVFDSQAMNLLVEYDWPGNVRELLDTVESLIVLTDSELIVADDVRRYLGQASPIDTNAATGLSDRLAEMERTLLIEALREADYNITAAARYLSIERSGLSKKLKRYAIDINALKQR